MFASTCRSPLLTLAVLLFGLALALAPARAVADGARGCAAGGFEGEHDHDRARHALECGEVMSLADVLVAVRPYISGEIVETEFEKEDGVWVYELKYIDARGRLMEIYVDARTGRILKVEDD